MPDPSVRVIYLLCFSVKSAAQERKNQQTESTYEEQSAAEPQGRTRPTS